MKKQLLLFLFTIVASVGTMFADGTKIGDLYYNLNATDKTAKVTYKSYANYYNLGWNITTADIPASVTYSGTTYSVTSIGYGAFSGCSSLTSVTIPNSVTSIGDYAFRDCSSLTSVTIPNSVTGIGNYAFGDCSSLASVTIPNSVTSIGGNAFFKCSGLTSVTIPNSVTSIESGAFWGCSSLTSVTIPNSVTSIGNEAFIGCSGLTSVTIPNSVTSIGSQAFSGCSSLTSVTIPNSVTSIVHGAFSGCSSLTSVTIPNSVTSIGYGAFSDCSRLTSVTIPNSITSIGDYAFDGCSSLTSVTIPNSVTSIGQFAFRGCSGLPVINNLRYADTYLVEAVDKTLSFYTIKNGTKWIGNNAFSGCSSLTSVTIPNSVTSIGDWAFKGCSRLTSVTIGNGVTSIGWDAFNGCSSLTSVTIPNSVTSIGGRAFSGCSRLTSVTIGNGVTSIGYGAFRGCSGLTSVTIPNSVTSIGEYAFEGCSSLTSVTIGNSVTSIVHGAFSGCSSLTSVTIPNSVTSIGREAFKNCSGLSRITIESMTPPAIGSDAFINTYCDIYVPKGTAYAYKNAWNEYADRIYEEDGQSGTVVSGKYKIGDLYYYLNENRTAEVTYELEWDEDNYRGLISANIPASVTYSGTTYRVTSIGMAAFWGCSGLTSVTIPNSVTSIGNEAFRGCSSLTSVTLEAETPPTFTGSSTFEYTNDCPIYVPCKALNAYKTAWLMYANRIHGYCESITVRLDPSSCSGWSTVRLWAWTDAGNVFDKWPGQVVSKDKEGWYSYTFDEDVSSVNIIWNNGIDQTVDIEGVTSSTCYAINSTTGTAITTKVVNCPDAVPTKYTIVFKNWDGSVLQSTQVEEGKMPQYTGTTPTKPSDSQYSYTFSGWTPQIVAAAADATYTATYNSIGKNNITVRLDPSSCSGWSTVRLWAWTDAGNVFDAWPGQVVSKDKEGWYSYTFDQDVTSVNIIWNNGIDQTVDIEGVTSSTCYALNSTTGTAITAKVVNCPDAVPTKYTIVFKNWDGSVLQSTQVEEGKMPQYTGATPTKPNDAQYSYTFSGWTPQIVAATANATYTATFTATKLPTDECDVKVTWLQTGGSGLGEITTDNSVVWKYDNRYGACAQAYSGATGWLLTPAKDLSNTSSVNLSFLHVHKNAGTFTDDMTLWVCADYKGSVDASQWQQLTISPYSANYDWVYVNVSIDVPLDMVGANTVFGFKYVSSNSSAKWEIKELHLNAECAKADETTITGVTATPNEDNSVTLTWPAVNGADTYTIEIKKNGVLVCTLVFNAYGQLISMNFATPARDGKGRNTAAAQEANGWMYVVTGLEGNSSYTYTITAKDTNGNVLLNQSVDFRTDAHTELNAINESSCQVSKVLRNGEVLIIRDGKMYNLQGVEVK